MEESKMAEVERKDEKNKDNRKINKHIYTWVGTFLFGFLGVNRFIRGQIVLGILKLITFGGCGLWFLIDWVIALAKLDQDGKDFGFYYDGGDWINAHLESFNKHVYTWVGTFLFGFLGLDRFMREQIKFGILKLITFGGCGVWSLIDWIIALTKLGQYEKNFVFDWDGDWDYISTKDFTKTNQRLKEAAKNGASPESVVGYRPIEKIKGLKNSKLYPKIKDICMELLRKEYQIGDVKAWHEDKYYDRACIHVRRNDKQLGTINFYDHVSDRGRSFIEKSYSSDYTHRNDEFHRKYGGTYGEHLIQDFPFLLIDSNTPCTEAPPEWLMICAHTMRNYRDISIEPIVTEPEWVSKNPEARKYVNVMFSKEGPPYMITTFK